MENQKNPKAESGEHSLTLCDRKRLFITYVKEVDDLSDDKILLTLFSGARMTVSGEKLKIEAFSRQTGQLSIDGLVCEIKYSGEKTSFLKRLIK